MGQGILSAIFDFAYTLSKMTFAAIKPQRG
jgi:hypothetical protein